MCLPEGTVPFSERMAESDVKAVLKGTVPFVPSLYVRRLRAR